MYDDFASVYDTLMDDFDYDEWSRHYLRLIRLATGELPRRAAECACGTGSLTVRLAQSGMAMTGVDLSAAMLRQAGKMDKRQEALLLALKPFLRKERQEKIDRALHAARLASLASLALKNRGRGPGAKETP